MESLTIPRARELVTQITQNDDGAHAPELLFLVCGISDPNNETALEVQRMLYAMTSDFQAHFKAYIDKLAA
jgi:hypothetical protein